MTTKLNVISVSRLALLLHESNDPRDEASIQSDALTRAIMAADHVGRLAEASTEGLTLIEWEEVFSSHENH